MILPSEATTSGRPWGPEQLRLHRHLLRHQGLLPKGRGLLLAVSGGQDSMALTTLLADLRRLHGWNLTLWHGDHRWREESRRQAEELAAWADAAGLPLVTDRADPAPAGEAAARQWRYRSLERTARRLCCGHVVTGHTASDRAETVLQNLARGSHLRGLASLRASRSLPVGEEGATPVRLVRPLLIFCREETAHLCRTRGVPVWPDPLNHDPRFARNRIRAQVMPVLEELHPGASRRISALSQRLEEEVEQEGELLALALKALEESGAAGSRSLRRRALSGLAPANQRRLLQCWLARHSGAGMNADQLGDLVARLAPIRGPGRQDLPGGWRLHWDPSRLRLLPPDPSDG